MAAHHRPFPSRCSRSCGCGGPRRSCRAIRLEKALGTPAKIFYKNEGVSPGRQPQAQHRRGPGLLQQEAGVKRLATETGAGQWGSALALACNFFGMECMVYMVQVQLRPEAASPHHDADLGREVRTLAQRPDRIRAARSWPKIPDSPGSLGIAISEAVEDAAGRKDTKYSLGSVLNHVLLHQTVIGQEAMAQLKMAGAYPDIVIGCCGGGSNFAGLAFPFMPEKAAGKKIRLIGRRARGLPHDDQGRLRLRFRRQERHDAAAEDGHARPRFHPARDSRRRLALSRHVAAGQPAAPRRDGGSGRATRNCKCFEAAITFARAEGIIVAPETSHAVAASSTRRVKAKEEGKERTILFNLSGHGHFDMAAYEKYFAGELDDYDYPEEKIKEALAHLPRAS